MLHDLTIPDELIAWGKDPSRAKCWAAPWAHEIEKMISAPGSLGPKQATALFSRLEALCAEALREERGDLLLGLDTYSAARLGLVYHLREGDRSVSLGAGRDVDYAEVEALLEARVDHEGALDAVEAKNLLGEVFPNGRVHAMVDLVESEEASCPGCGSDLGAISFEMESGSRYCRACWSYLTGPWPRVTYRGTKLVVTRGES